MDYFFSFTHHNKFYYSDYYNTITAYYDFIKSTEPIRQIQLASDIPAVFYWTPLLRKNIIGIDKNMLR